jgi:uncharacterized protein YcfJ
MKNTIKKIVLGLVGASAIVTSAQASGYSERISVTSSEPIYAEVRTSAKFAYQKNCEQVWVEDRNYHNSNSGITHDETIGTLLGGAIGNKLGSGGHSDRRAFGTILGAVIGNKIATNDVGYDNKPSGHYEDRCSNVRVLTQPAGYDTKLVGYKLTGTFNGKTITTKSSKLSNYITVRVSY